LIDAGDQIVFSPFGTLQPLLEEPLQHYEPSSMPTLEPLKIIDEKLTLVNSSRLWDHDSKSFRNLTIRQSVPLTARKD
jgi:hypothetical protein